MEFIQSDSFANKLDLLIVKVNNLQSTADENTNKLSELQSSNGSCVMDLKLSALSYRNSQLADSLIKLETYSYRDCLLFSGIKEETN
jgi:hypothetical protein